MSKQLPQVLHEWTEVFMHRSFHDFKHFMDDAELSTSQASTLMRLYHGASCGFSNISTHLGVTSAATSQLVDRLVQMQLITREEDPADRRNKILNLTPEGKALIERGIAARTQWMQQLTRELTPEQQEMIASALTVLTAAARKLESGGTTTSDTLNSKS